jgi:probable HAF family extracellular repeat protein
MTGLALMAPAVSAAGVARPARAGTAYILTDLGTLPGGTGGQGLAVNDSGQVAGFANTAGPLFPNHAFLSGKGGGPLQDLGTLPGAYDGYGTAVNDSGQVAGYSRLTSADPSHAFLSGKGGGPLQDLGTLPGGTTSVGFAVNASGQVAGYSDTAGGATHAFLSGLDGGPLKDLGALPGAIGSFGYGVNDSGQVVGYSNFLGDGSITQRAFLYSGGQMLDLNDLIAPGSGFTLQYAYGISDTGYIAGIGTAPDGFQHPFLLTPVPEPAGLVLLGTGAAALLGYAARRRDRTRA